MDILYLVNWAESSLGLFLTVSFSILVLLIFILVIINNELAKLGIVFLVLLGVLFLGLNYYYDHRFAELKAIAKQISDEKNKKIPDKKAENSTSEREVRDSKE